MKIAHKSNLDHYFVNVYYSQFQHAMIFVVLSLNFLLPPFFSAPLLLRAHSIRLWIFPQCLNPIQHKNNTTHLSIFCRLLYIYIKKLFPSLLTISHSTLFILFAAVATIINITLVCCLVLNFLILTLFFSPSFSLPTTTHYHPLQTTQFSLSLTHKCDIEIFYILFYCVHISFLHWALMMGKTQASRIITAATTTTTTSCRSFENNINIFVHFFKWIDDNNGKAAGGVK